MKKLIFPAVFSLMVLACSGQNSTSISFDPSFMLTASFHGKDDGTWIQKVTRLNVMVLDGKKTADAQRWSSLPHELRDDKFEDLLSFHKGGQRLQLMSRDGKEGLKEIAFLAGDGLGGLYIQFAGKFTSKDLDQMLSSVRDKDEQ
jgi:hypothetical protein